MKVKKYQARSMPEVMSQVKKEMGSDAVILNSKVVYRGGFLGLFKKKNMEVIAAIDPDNRESQREGNPNQIKEETKPVQPLSPPDNQSTDLDVIREIKAMKKLLERQQPQSFPLASPFHEIYERLMEQEVAPAIAEEIIKEWKEHNSDITPEGGIYEVISSAFNHFNPPLSFGGIDYRNQYIQFVGPTGVGKTTTIAKVAAQAVLSANKKVAFITTDTYRIAAIEQLKTYAELLNVPIEVAYSTEDYMAAREQFAAYDLVLIDTAGRNFRDAQYIKELKELIDFGVNMETYLVLSLTSRYRDMQVIYDQFHEVPIHKLIFTKADETSTFGSAFNMLYHNKVGAAYITDGQNVPDDIRGASIDWVASRIAGDSNDA
ncbi:flagellar biosynthesis protein FlhF [Thalassobacillus sp. B23F22_16]|uniref:flagellar biosynthesis protein FlhF n=1 Tax=Thalassobacillus sp. B23F22_16 TaxID=3459513 RepID=UPI00373F611F